MQSLTQIYSHRYFHLGMIVIDVWAKSFFQRSTLKYLKSVSLSPGQLRLSSSICCGLLCLFSLLCLDKNYGSALFIICLCFWTTQAIVAFSQEIIRLMAVEVSFVSWRGEQWWKRWRSFTIVLKPLQKQLLIIVSLKNC